MYNPRSRLLLAGSYGGFEVYLAQLHALVAELGVSRRPHPRAGHERGAHGALRRRRPLSLRERARRLLRAARRSLSQAACPSSRTRPPPCPRRWTAAACCIDTRDPRQSPRSCTPSSPMTPWPIACSTHRTPRSHGCRRRTSTALVIEFVRRRPRAARAGRRRPSPTISGASSASPKSSTSIRQSRPAAFRALPEEAGHVADVGPASGDERRARR